MPPSAAELGLSEQDYKDALNLEKIYQLAHANACTKCGSNDITHYQPDSVDFLCSSCSLRKPRAKKLGVDPIRNTDLKKFETKFSRSVRRQKSLPKSSSSSSPSPDIRRKHKNHSSHNAHRHKSRKPILLSSSSSSSTDSPSMYSTKNLKRRPGRNHSTVAKAPLHTNGYYHSKHPIPGMMGVIAHQGRGAFLSQRSSLGDQPRGRRAPVYAPGPPDYADVSPEYNRIPPWAVTHPPAGHPSAAHLQGPPFALELRPKQRVNPFQRTASGPGLTTQNATRRSWVNPNVIPRPNLPMGRTGYNLIERTVLGPNRSSSYMEYDRGGARANPFMRSEDCLPAGKILPTGIASGASRRDDLGTTSEEILNRLQQQQHHKRDKETDWLVREKWKIGRGENEKHDWW